MSLPTIIPTPKHIETLSDQILKLPKGHTLRACALDIDLKHPVMRYAIKRLRDSLASVSIKLRITNKATADPQLTLAIADHIEHPQGYRLKTYEAGQIKIRARELIGLSYGIATLIQLLQNNKRNTTLPHVYIADEPGFEMRGNNWLFKAEISHWSFDQGDGIAKCEARMMRQLDLAWLHKINLIYLDGFGWNPDRFPGYCKFIQRLTAAARARGIGFAFGGMNANYMLGGYTSHQFKNRKRYPDGPTYPCVSFPPGHGQSEKVATCGTCFSNRKLNELKAEELGQFTKAIEPGLLYIHHIDTGGVTASEKCWNMRCEQCRKRWPNDQVDAPDGMAGAIAHLMNRLATDINNVNNPKTGYHAKRDCKIMLVGPIYSSWLESDRKWQQVEDYFIEVSKLLEHDNIVICLREMYLNHRNKTQRIAHFQSRLDQEAKGHKQGIITFWGGDNFYNNQPVQATPVLNEYMLGAQVMIMSTGNRHQQPQAIINSEFMWNPSGSQFMRCPQFSKFRELESCYDRMSRAEELPDEIFGAAGLLEIACERVFGKAIAKLIADMYRLQTDSALPPQVRPQPLHIDNLRKLPIWMPVDSVLLPSIGRVFNYFGPRPTLNDNPYAFDTKKLHQVFQDSLQVNKQAVALLRKAMRRSPSDPIIMDDLAWFAQSLQTATAYIDLFCDYLQVYMAKNPDAMRKLLAKVQKKTDRLEKKRAAGQFGPPAELTRGEQWIRKRTLECMQDNIQTLRESLRTDT